MSRPFAVFDIDGTIIRWQLYHAIGDELARRGFIDAAEFGRVRAMRMNWKRRTGSESFHDYEMALVAVFNQAITGLSVKTFESVMEAAFDEYKEQVYTYTRDLIRALKAKHYLLFAISVSPAMIVEKLADYYDFDDFAGSLYLTKNGRFTGEIELSLGKKPELLQALIAKHRTSLKGSLAVGDSEGDIDMLAMVEQPIAFNPSKKLFQHARQHRWEIVLERKNMVYELEPKDGRYRLKG
jgi:HAD superfamily hydrolase (TIGR01490 family)